MSPTVLDARAAIARRREKLAVRMLLVLFLPALIIFIALLPPTRPTSTPPVVASCSPLAGFPADIDGRPHPASELRGHIVVLLIGATWARPALAELWPLESLYTRRGADGLDVLAVLEGGTLDPILPFTRRLGITFPVIHDPARSLAAACGATELPTTLVFDRAGALQFVHRGFHTTTPDALESDVHALLAVR